MLIIFQSESKKPLDALRSTPYAYKSIPIHSGMPQTLNSKSQIPYKSAISLRIYDAGGRLVRQWDYQTMRLSDQVVWQGEDDIGCRVPAGIYFVRLQTEDDFVIKKVIVLH